MGEMVEFPSNGTTVQGYVAAPDAGGPGVVVIQEWWGLVDHIKDVCDRFAAEGFVAVAPDLYHGETTTEPDGAGKMMMAMNVDRAARDMAGAIDYVRDRGDAGDSVGVVGFCMGGGLALYLGTLRPDDVAAVVPFYGVTPWETVQPDWSLLTAAVQGHFGDRDDFLPVDQVRALEEDLKDAGVDVEFFIYDGAGHAFFNDAQPEAHAPEASANAWSRAIPFLRERLG